MLERPELELFLTNWLSLSKLLKFSGFSDHSPLKMRLPPGGELKILTALETGASLP